jgi:hypothetical protein
MQRLINYLDNSRKLNRNIFIDLKPYYMNKKELALDLTILLKLKYKNKNFIISDGLRYQLIRLRGV